jgi:hypothetical protein
VKHQRRSYRRTTISPPKRSSGPPAIASSAGAGSFSKPRGNSAHLEPGELTFTTLPFVGKFFPHKRALLYMCYND